MSNKNFVKSLALFLSLLAMSANANLIVNGSFESTDVNSSNLAPKYLYPENADVPTDLADIGTGNTQEWGIFDQLQGWSAINDAGVEVHYNGVAGRNAAEGDLYLELDTGNLAQSTYDNQVNGSATNGGITQEVTGLISNDFYNFSFAFMGRSAVSNSNDFILTIGSVVYNFDNILKEFDWTTSTFQFQATSETMNVTFAAVGAADGKGALIDNVSLTKLSVPEPSVFALMLMGLFGFAFRKKS